MSKERTIQINKEIAELYAHLVNVQELLTVMPYNREKILSLKLSLKNDISHRELLLGE